MAIISAVSYLHKETRMDNLIAVETAASVGEHSEAKEIGVEVPVNEKPNNTDVVHLSQLHSTQELTKVISMVDGKFSKQPSLPLYHGCVKDLVGNFDKLGDVLKELSDKKSHNFAIALGVTGSDNFQPLTTKKLSAKDTTCITRSKDHFTFHDGGSVMLLDYDPKDSNSLSFEEFRDKMSEAWPDFKSVPMWFKSSTSANIRDAHGNAINKGNGFHCYVYVKNGKTIPDLGKTVFDRLWLNCQGEIFISKSGGMHARTIIDAAVFYPERIVFTARPILYGGLVQDDPEVKFYPGNYDYDLPQPLTSVELAKVASLKISAKAAKADEAKSIKDKYQKDRSAEYARVNNVSLPEAKRIIASRLDYEISHEDSIYFNKFGMVNMLTVLADPEKYDNEYCADPLEPEEGSSRAIYNARFNNKSGAKPAMVHSFLHGGSDFLVSDSAQMSLFYQELEKGSQDIETIGAKIAEKKLSNNEEKALFEFYKSDNKPIVREYNKLKKRFQRNQEAQDAWDTLEADSKRDGSTLIKVKARSESLIRTIEAEFFDDYSIFYSKGRLHQLVRNKLEAFTIDILDTFLGEKFTFYTEKEDPSTGVVVPTVVDTPRDLARKMGNHQRLNFNQVEEVVYHPYVSKKVVYADDRTSTTTYSIFRKKGINCDTGIMSAFSQGFPEFEEKSAEELMKLMFEETARKRMDNKILVMAAVMTGIQAKMIQASPGFIISSSMEKLGKTTLAKIIQTYIAGNTVPGVDLPYKKKDFNEFIFKEFLHYPPCLCFDNLPDDSEIKTEGLSALLSDDRMTGRLYFSQKNAEVSTRCLMLFTGNRITCSKDLARKMINLQINYSEGEFVNQDFIGYAKAKRAEVIDGILKMIMRHINKPWPKGLTKSDMSNDFDQQILKVLHYETALDVWKVAMSNVRSNEKEQTESLIQMLCDLPKDINYGKGEDNGSDVGGYLEVELLKKALSEPQGELAGVTDSTLEDLRYGFDMLQEGVYKSSKKFTLIINTLTQRQVSGKELRIKKVRSTRRQCLYVQ